MNIIGEVDVYEFLIGSLSGEIDENHPVLYKNIVQNNLDEKQLDWCI